MEETKMKRSTKKSSKEKDPSEKGPPVKDGEKNKASAKPTKKELKPESVFPASSNDQPTDKDFLGFEPYVRAIAEFLTNENTKPPLVLSIEGEWGSGKSSFMLQLKEKLLEVEKKRRFREQKANPSFKSRLKRWYTPWKPLTVWFNAWRHEQEDALWAAFALRFLKQVSSQRNWFQRQMGNFFLFWRRFKWKEGWLDLLHKSLLSILAISVIIIIPIWVISDPQYWVNGLREMAKTISDKDALQNIFTKGIQVGGIVTYVAFLFFFFKKLKEFFGNPLEIDLKKYLQAPNYQNRVTFIEQFHEDFNRIVSAYARNQKVYVFIDDLDRCDVPKAADLMKSLNLMISKDPRLIFIIGMDREKVAAGLAVKHKELLNYLYIPSFTIPESEDGAMAKLCGLEYGFDFIEKFVQLPFILPVPTNDDLDNYLVSITGFTRKDWTKQRPDKSLEKTEHEKDTEHETGEKSVEPNLTENSQKERRESIKIQVSEDYNTIEKVLKLVAPALERNPRRIKQFINLFRLRVYIAAETGLFDIPEGSNDTALTLEQLGKFVAIQLKWPLLLVDLERYPTLVKELQLKALSVKKSNDIPEVIEVTRWSSRNDLMALLREGCINDKGEGDPTKRREVSLENINFEKLLQVSPKIRDIESFIEKKEVLEEKSETSKVESIAGADKTKEKKSVLTRIFKKKGPKKRPSSEPERPPLNREFVEQCITKLKYLMEIEKVYCDADISLQSLSDKMSIAPHLLSQLLNEKMDRNFADFINVYRIEEAKKIMQSPRGPQRKVSAVAIEVGFNTMAAFYNAFKKYTGMPPTQYRKEVQNKK